MKKTKLLTSLVALALVLSLGACNNEDDTNLENDDESSESSSSSFDDTGTITYLYNYTLTFTFEKDGVATLIPDYASVYVIGGWNSFVSFIPLEESNGSYSTTFSSIRINTHEYKVVMCYDDEEVNWNNCVEITSDYQKLEVSLENGDNYIKEITLDLNVTLLSRDEILEKTLDAIKSYSNASDLKWDAYYYNDKNGDKEDTYYLTLDENEDIYGYSENIDENGSTYTYYLDGLKRVHYLSSEDNQYTSEQSSEDYLFALSEYSLPFDLVKDSEFDLTNYTYYVTRRDGNYLVSLTKGNEEYTYLADNDFNLVELDYVNGATSYSAKEITFAEVETTLSGYNHYRWESPKDIEEFIENGYLECNYSVHITYDTYTGNETKTYAEYEEDPDSVFEELSGGETSLYSTAYVDIYYMPDCVLMKEYQYDEGEYYLYFEEILMNSDNRVWDYYCFRPESSDSVWQYDTYTGYTWIDLLYSLNDAYIDNLGSHFVLNSSGEDDNGSYDLYDVDELDYAAYWFACLGNDFLFYPAYDYGYDYFTHNGTYLYHDSQKLVSFYNNAGLTWDDDTLTSTTELYYVDNELSATIYNVGDTDESETCYYYHNHFQTLI